MSKSPKKKILHITPHLGAGVGTVVLHYLAKVAKNGKYEHKIACLDYANENAKEISKKSGFVLFGDMRKNVSNLFKMIEAADIVLLHWWNHPMLFDLLVRQKLPKCRLVLWSHTSGYPAPINFTDKILKYPDIFVFTTPLSYKTEEVKRLPPRYRKKLRDIWSTGGLERVKNIKLKKHKGFNVGYIGTVDYTKMHPNFLDRKSVV